MGKELLNQQLDDFNNKGLNTLHKKWAQQNGYRYRMVLWSEKKSIILDVTKQCCSFENAVLSESDIFSPKSCFKLVTFVVFSFTLYQDS